MLKKFLKKLSAVGIFSALAFVSSPAQAMPLSLAESIEMALENDESIDAAEFSRESAKWSLSSARRQTGPTLSWRSQAEKIPLKDANFLLTQRIFRSKTPAKTLSLKRFALIIAYCNNKTTSTLTKVPSIWRTSNLI